MKTSTQGFDAAETYYELSGDAEAPTIVLLHGVGLDHTMWQPYVDEFSSEFRVLRYDLIGHGRTPRGDGVQAVRDFTVQLHELLAHLAIDRIWLVGFSLGAVVSQRFAGEYADRLDGLILLNAVYRRTEEELQGIRQRLRLTEAEGTAATVDAAIERWFTLSYQQQHPEVIEQVRERLLSNDLQGYVAAYRVFVNADDEIGDALCDVRCPTLIMTGEHDVGSTPDMAQRMARDLARPRVVVLPGLRHMAPLEGAGQMIEEIRNFIREHM